MQRITADMVDFDNPEILAQFNPLTPGLRSAGARELSHPRQHALYGFCSRRDASRGLWDLRWRRFQHDCANYFKARRLASDVLRQAYDPLVKTVTRGSWLVRRTRVNLPPIRCVGARRPRAAADRLHWPRWLRAQLQPARNRRKSLWRRSGCRRT